MRKIIRTLKFLQMMAICSSLMPLSLYAQCPAPSEKTGVIEQLYGDSMDLMARATSSREIGQICISQDARGLLSNGENNYQFPLVPKNYEQACGCFKEAGFSATEEEIKNKHLRMKKLKYRFDELKEYLGTKDAVENSLLTFLNFYPSKKLPAACEKVLGDQAELEGTDSCRSDLERLVNAQLKVESFTLHSDKAQDREGVASTNSFRVFNAVRSAVRDNNFKYGEGFYPPDNKMGPMPEPKIDNVSASDIIDYITGGIRAEALVDNRKTGLLYLTSTNDLLKGGGLDVSETQVIPFAANEVDAAAAQLMANLIKKGLGTVNDGLTKALKDPNVKDSLLEGTSASNPKQRIGKLILILGTIPEVDLMIPEEVNVPSLGGEGGNNFEKAVGIRFSQMAKAFNSSGYMKAAAHELVSLGPDGTTFEAKPAMDDNLLKLASTAYNLIESGDALSRQCENAYKQRQKICAEVSDDDLKDYPLYSKDINFYAAVDLQRGDEAEYGKVVCGSFDRWKKSRESGYTSWIGALSQVDGSSWMDYQNSSCNQSTVTHVTDIVSFFTAGCNEVERSQEQLSLAQVDDIPESLEDRATVMAAQSAVSAVFQDETVVVSVEELNSSNRYSLPDGPTNAFGASKAQVGGLAGKGLRDRYGPYRSYGVYDDFDAEPERFARKTNNLILPKARPAFQATIESNMPTTELSPSALTGNTASKQEDSFTGSVTPEQVEGGFGLGSIFKPSITNGSRSSILDDRPIPLLPDQDSADELEQRALTDSELQYAKELAQSTKAKHDSELETLASLRSQVEQLKGKLEDKERTSLLDQIRKASADLEKKRKEVEALIETESNKRASAVATPPIERAKNQQSSASTFSSGNEPTFRPLAQPTYPSEVAEAPVRGNVAAPSGLPTTNVSARRAADFSAGTISSNGNTALGAAASAPAARGAGSLRLMTAQAFDKLSSRDFETLYETNQGGAIFVEKSVADGNGSRNIVIEKYLPEVIEGEVVYINQGEVLDLSDQDPGRSIASVAAPEVVEEAEVEAIRRVKELDSYQNTLYSPIHQELIDKLQKAIAEQRQ